MAYPRRPGYGMSDYDRAARRSQARPAGRAYVRAYPAGRNRPVRRDDTYRLAERAKKQRARQRHLRRQRMSMLMAVVLIIGIFFAGKAFYQDYKDASDREKESKRPQLVLDTPTDEEVETTTGLRIKEDLLNISEYNRPGTKLAAVKNIFVHYTANPNTSAAQNKSYFENLAETHERAASAHFIIGYKGEIIQCIPLDEEAYAVKGRNNDSISIECCYIDRDGAFTKETYDTLIRMLVWLTDQYDLEPQDILRHYDHGGKRCPLYYVEHEDEWEKLLADVAASKGL